MSWFASRDLYSRVNLASKLQLRILEGKIWRWNGKAFPTITLDSLRKEKGRTKTKHYYLHHEEARGCVSGRRELPICLCVWAPEQWGSGALQCPLSWQLSDESPMSCRSPEQEKRTVEPEVNFSPLMAACGGVPGWPQSTSAWQGDKWENKAARAFKDLFFSFQVRQRIPPCSASLKTCASARTSCCLWGRNLVLVHAAMFPIYFINSLDIMHRRR